MIAIVRPTGANGPAGSHVTLIAVRVKLKLNFADECRDGRPCKINSIKKYFVKKYISCTCNLLPNISVVVYVLNYYMLFVLLNRKVRSCNLPSCNLSFWATKADLSNFLRSPRPFTIHQYSSQFHL